MIVFGEFNEIANTGVTPYTPTPEKEFVPITMAPSGTVMLLPVAAIGPVNWVLGSVCW
jgi:hypothetical protein